MSECSLVMVFLGSSVLVAFALVHLIMNTLDGWRPFQQQHPFGSYHCPKWQWAWKVDWTTPCYHKTPDGPRCCNCGLKPPKETR